MALEVQLHHQRPSHLPRVQALDELHKSQMNCLGRVLPRLRQRLHLLRESNLKLERICQGQILQGRPGCQERELCREKHYWEASSSASQPFDSSESTRGIL